MGSMKSRYAQQVYGRICERFQSRYAAADMRSKQLGCNRIYESMFRSSSLSTAIMLCVQMVYKKGFTRVSTQTGIWLQACLSIVRYHFGWFLEMSRLQIERYCALYVMMKMQM